MRMDYRDLFGSIPEDYTYPAKPAEEVFQSFSRQVSSLLKRLKHFSLELVGLAAASFLLTILLAANSGDLNGYRAYFLSTGRDIGVVLILALAAYRFLRRRDETH